MSAKRATLASVEPHIHNAVEDKPVVKGFIPHHLTKAKKKHEPKAK